jgi:hypothetical protein
MAVSSEAAILVDADQIHCGKNCGAADYAAPRAGCFCRSWPPWLGSGRSTTTIKSDVPDRGTIVHAFAEKVLGGTTEVPVAWCRLAFD